MAKKENLSAVLIVDDEPAVLQTLTAILEDQFRVLSAINGKEALDKISQESIDLVFLDINMPDMEGMEALRKIKQFNENISVVMATATDSARAAVDSIQLGACDYITKPFDADEVIAIASRAIETTKLLNEVTYFRSQKEEIRFDNIIGESRKIKAIYKIVEKVAKNNATILVSGESGTGKELVARAIHFNSPRRQKPFIAINCASIPEGLMESELFGHEKGAFTDAVSQKLGMFELANEGTLFLDEISDLKLDLQAKLLRVLEDRKIKRLGRNKIIRIDVRIISATNIDLKEAMQEGRFRQDLFYRLNVIPVHLPPLRERGEDMPLLIKHFLGIYNQIFKKNIGSPKKEIMRCLMNYTWPGNIRELKKMNPRRFS
ncbi:sigma-54-dependent transcriptional regulator [Candidatus Omnitrophota bacterium]